MTCGNGVNINIWTNPCIPSDGVFQPITPNLQQVQDVYVSDLLCANETWNIDVLLEFFWEEDVDQIVRIPLPVSNGGRCAGVALC